MKDITTQVRTEAQLQWDQAVNKAGLVTDSLHVNRALLTIFVIGQSLGLIRLVQMEDLFSTPSCIEGDMYNASVNPEIDPEELSNERRRFYAKCVREGIHGVRLEARASQGDEWKRLDSIGGLIGDEFIGSETADEFIEAGANWLTKNLDIQALMDANRDRFNTERDNLGALEEQFAVMRAEAPRR
ncbi:hypothetical protein YA0089_26300 [Pseudomonas viridiflava]|uniref:hypothetical protein n=1 Tax=Pseudomonas viridiflava TaxID=33069 RepID=UPI0018E5BD7A|nr:hypothetical protein [Pseudomonas viridiflava]MBI6727128.1 hypothetical protein [Pseudomonas viridiflava]